MGIFSLASSAAKSLLIHYSPIQKISRAPVLSHVQTILGQTFFLLTSQLTFPPFPHGSIWTWLHSKSSSTPVLGLAQKIRAHKHQNTKNFSGPPHEETASQGQRTTSSPTIESVQYQYQANGKHSNTCWINKWMRDFPCCPLAKTPSSQCRGPNHWSGN